MYYRTPETIPLPANDDEFERLCLLVVRDKYGAEYYRYGRKGQTQYGIDIYSAYRNGRCIQCKLHKKGISDDLLIRELKEDFQKAKEKFYALKQFIFAISVETRPKIQDICEKLSDDNIKVVPWFWNQMQEDIARSKWLLRYYLDYMPGAQWINDDFVKEEIKKGETVGWEPINFYSSNTLVQWYGILRRWDAPRQHRDNICHAIKESFADIFSDIPVAAIIRGDGGSGKSVLLRRISIDLRNDYTIYWIADNAADFLENEWIFDIENNPNENYLLVVEDWYRNFSKTEDRVTANILLQKVKSKTNVRLLIGDRPATQIYYPKSKASIYNLEPQENATLLLHIIDQIPEWKNKFSHEQTAQLLNTGLFQLLFVYQYGTAATLSPKASNYFLEVIQSDYKQLSNSEDAFYRGLALVIYIYGNLYTDYSLVLTLDAVIMLAEKYSGVNRSFVLRNNAETLLRDPLINRYFALVIDNKKLFYLKFLHDILADEGWKNVDVGQRNTFGSAASVIEIMEEFRAKGALNDLSNLIQKVSTVKPGFIPPEHIVVFLDFLVRSKCESSSYVGLLFSDTFPAITEKDLLVYIHNLIGIGNDENGMWRPLIRWLNTHLPVSEQLKILKEILDAGNKCPVVLLCYYQNLPIEYLEANINTEMLLGYLQNPSFQTIAETLRKRLKDRDKKLRDTAMIYLQLDNPQQIAETFVICLKLVKYEPIAKEKAMDYLQLSNPENNYKCFTTCLKLLRDRQIAKEKALYYLNIPGAEKSHESFVTCLKILKDEPVAKQKAYDYLRSPNSEKIFSNFTACLQLLADQPIAKKIAAKYTQSTDAEKIPQSFAVCLKILDADALSIVEDILDSPIGKRHFLIIYQALLVASKFENLDNLVEKMLTRIIDDNRGSSNNYKYLYLQAMKLPLFRIKIWQIEVSKRLANYKYINRNLFYSLTLCYMDDPHPLASACLYFVRNWEDEFSIPKNFWAYFTRCLAHPIIKQQQHLREEVRQLCGKMIVSNTYPYDLKLWITSIAEEDMFPRWKEDVNEE